MTDNNPDRSKMWQDTDNMPPHEWAFSDDKIVKDYAERYARAYAEQRNADLLAAALVAEQQTAELTGLRVELEQAVAVAHSRLFQIESLKQQTEILEKTSSDNFALYYECKRDRKKLLAEVDLLQANATGLKERIKELQDGRDIAEQQIAVLKSKIDNQSIYNILELLTTKLKDKQ